MNLKGALRMAGVVLFVASAAAAQERTALYGRVVGSDHEREVPPGWVVRVTAVREGSGEILDQRDSSGELYCVRVPTNARVRLLFETSFRPPGEQLGYGSVRLGSVIDTTPADRRDSFRPQPDAILPRKHVNQGATARFVTHHELDVDFAIAIETGSVDIIGAKMVNYRAAYSHDTQIMADIDKTAGEVRDKPEFKELQNEELFKGLTDLNPFRNGFPLTIDPSALMRLAGNRAIFSDLRSQAILTLAAHYASPRDTASQTNSATGYSRPDIPSDVLEFFRAQTASSSPDLLLASFIALAKIGTSADKQAIVRKVSSDNPDHVVAAIVAIGEGRLAEGAPALAALLQKESTPALEMLAARSLAILARAKVDVAITALKQAVVQDRQRSVRVEAAEQLGTLFEVYPETRKLLRDVEKNDASPEVRVAARMSLEREKP